VKSPVNVSLGGKIDLNWKLKETLSGQNLTEIMGLQKSNVRFVVLTAVKMSVLFFWIVTLCGLVCTYSFGEACCLHLQAEFSKMLISTYKSTQCNNTKGRHREKEHYSELEAGISLHTEKIFN
jgi:hypothetical protein